LFIIIPSFLFAFLTAVLRRGKTSQVKTQDSWVQSLVLGGRVCAVFSRITGGQDAQEGRWPWQVRSLIAAQWVVSAAHCFNRKQLSQHQCILGDLTSHHRMGGNSLNSGLAELRGLNFT
uniref:Peptidase S1 domain-containing protein n=1 Tax=Chelonoidis abingdonii TaxID=106734 RepID=A0A8C0JEP9_CHEAB